MGAVVMHIDVVHFFGIAVASDMAAAFEHEAFLSAFGSLVGKDASVKSGTYYYIIVFFHYLFFFLQRYGFFPNNT